MTEHTKGGLSVIIFKLTFLATVLAGIFQLFMITMFSPPSNPQPRKIQQHATATDQGVQQESHSQRFRKPSVNLLQPTHVFHPKELIEATDPLGHITE